MSWPEHAQRVWTAVHDPAAWMAEGRAFATQVMWLALHVLFSLHQIVRNAHGHAAVETLPRGFARHWFWGRFTTTTHHHLHHERARGNDGLWFTWWDRLCGTELPEYLNRYDQATGAVPRPTPTSTSTSNASIA
jgi:lathosterol oxidase